MNRLIAPWLLIGLLCVHARARETRDTTEIADLASMIVTRINENYSHLNAVEMTFEGEQTASLEGLEKVRGRPLSPDEIKMFAPEPRTERYKYTLHKGRARLESRLGTDKSSLTLYVDGVVTQYKPSLQHAWVRLTQDSQIGAYPPVRITQIGFQYDTDFPECVRDWKCTAAEIGTGPNNSTQITLTATQGAAGNIISRTSFSSLQNFLPIRKVLSEPDGSVREVVQFEYKEVIDGKTWVLSRFISELFPRGSKRSDDTTSNGWSQHLEYRLTDVQLYDEAPAGAFDLDFPDGTVVMDRVKRRNYIEGSPNRPKTINQSTSARYWLIGINVCVVLVLSAVFYSRRRLRST